MTSVRRRHNVVYRVLFFAVFHLFSSASITRTRATRCSGGATLRVTVFFRNVGWRVLVIWGSILYILTCIVLTVFTVFDVVRNEWFYGAMIMITEFPRGWLLLFTFVLATEIADVGHEGVTVGLTISFQALAGLADFTLAALYPDIMGFKVSEEQVEHDSKTTRSNVIKAFAIVTVVNLLCLTVRLLPQQKLDAQQLRAFGGYNKYASTALVVTFAVLLTFNLACNLIVVFF